MAGEQHGLAVVAGMLADEVADRRLGGDVQADGGLVQEQQVGPMQQAGGDLAPHPLAERHAVDRLVQQLGQGEAFGQLPQPLGEGGRLLVVDVAQQGEALAGRQFAPELGALAEHHADPVGQRLALLPGRQAQHRRLARGRLQDAREHLQGRGLARAIGADDGHPLALADLEIDAGDGLDRHVLGGEGLEEAAAPLSVAVGLGERLDGDDGGHGGLQFLRGSMGLAEST